MSLRWVWGLLALSAVAAFGQATGGPPGQTKEKPWSEVDDSEGWVRKSHSATLKGQTYTYTSTVGSIPSRDATSGETQGHIYFIEYRLDSPSSTSKRPVTFVFNGGPGSASLWLHLGFVGPKRVKMLPDGMMPPPPYELAPNDESLLPVTDLVLIDPVGTGYSRPEKPEFGAKFWGVQEDIHSVGEFIRTWLSLENRWTSPTFVMGESYGGIRGSGLSQYLTQSGVGLNGLILVSPYINGSIQDPAKGNDQPYAFYLPTYAAAAWYHKKLSPAMEKMQVGDLVKQVQNWVYDVYLPALLRGEQLSPAKRKEIEAQLEKYTGLSAKFLNDSNLRIRDFDYFKELLRDQRYTVGRYDARFKGMDRLWVSEGPDYDPSDSQVTPPFTSCMNDYIRNELGFKTNLRYYVLGEGMTGGWKMGEGAVDTSDMLRDAMHQNPYTKLFVAMGYYDLACPLGTVEQVLNQMELDPRLHANVTRGYYPAGHMMYLDTDARRKLSADISKFITDAAHPSAPDRAIR